MLPPLQLGDFGAVMDALPRAVEDAVVAVGAPASAGALATPGPAGFGAAVAAVSGHYGLQAPADAKLAPHLVWRSEVPAFLHGSLVQATLHHGVRDDETLESIARIGLRADRNTQGVYGQLSYFALQPDAVGPHDLEAAVRAYAPYVVGDGGRMQMARDLGLSLAQLASDTSAARDALRGAGYDSVVVPQGGRSSDWLAVVDDGAIKLVVDRAGSPPHDPHPAGLHLPTR